MRQTVAVQLSTIAVQRPHKHNHNLQTASTSPLPPSLTSVLSSLPSSSSSSTTTTTTLLVQTTPPPSNHNIDVYDVTVGIPKLITIEAGVNDADTGEGAVTLYTMGWFPRALLQGVPRGEEYKGGTGWEGVWGAEDDDTAVNTTPATTSITTTTKQPKVAEIFEAVEKRFDGEVRSGVEGSDETG